MAVIIIVTIVCTIYVGGIAFLLVDFLKDNNIKLIPFPEKLFILAILLFWPAMIIIDVIAKVLKRSKLNK